MRRRWLAALLGASTLCACYVPPTRSLGGPLLPIRDTMAAAFETGRHDALVRHVARPTPIMLLAPPVASTIAIATHEFWTFPATIALTSAASVAMTYRQTRRPLPLPPDSMRTRYGLDGAAWDAYRRGFSGAVAERRREVFRRTVQVAVFTTALSATYWVVIQSRPRYR